MHRRAKVKAISNTLVWGFAVNVNVTKQIAAHALSRTTIGTLFTQNKTGQLNTEKIR